MMKTLKMKMVVALISVIVIPLAVIAGTLTLLSLSIERVAGEIESSHQQTTEEIQALLKELPSVTSSEFDQRLDEISESYDVALDVTYQGEQVYGESLRNTSPNGLAFNYTPDVIEGETSRGEPVQAELFLQSTELESKILTYILISIGSGILALLLTIGLWVWLLSKSVLRPLKSVYEASEEARKGNLEYPVQQGKKDEIGRFISSFNLMRQEIKDSFAKQQEYERARQELIAGISHDLRTPLSSIQGYVEGLRDGVVKSEEKQQKYLNIIHKKTLQVDSLIEDLFDLTRLELRKLPVYRQPVVSTLFTDDLIEYMETAEHDHRMLIKGSVAPAVILEIDPLRMQQVMTNLIDNAFRYGGDRVEISTRLSNHNWHIDLMDNGHGMDRNLLEKVFTPFYRADQARTDGGSGLGLSIAKSIVEAHSGKLSVISEKGTGSTFTVSLPFKREDEH
ncbi:sensor histidine kinase [Jeotgalibacillus salarius]|uniref:histidine kinase n=1 Tax=Jeotgalibacillus salarius TaxID=546023 RepID=A0A4Y8LN57_9BACL|nr:sensor histidine kinase [Jeotgalibacillus salarius]TFE02183.1 sensor histidine kinase [Jeotgalibacillus salarius]